MDASLRTSRLKDRVLYSNTLAKQLLVNQGRLASWRNPQTTSGSMAELIDVIKGELVTTPAEQQAVIDANTPSLVSIVVVNRSGLYFQTSPFVPNAFPNLANIPNWRNIEVVSPFNVGPFDLTNPDDTDGDYLPNEQMGGTTLAALSAQCTGKAVLIQRGGINFENKIVNAIAAGAVMVIVYNSNVGGSNTNISFAGLTPKSIPLFSMWNNIGQTILEILRSGKKLYATFETDTYSRVDNRPSLRITENQVSPSEIFPNTFSGIFNSSLVTYTVSTSKSRASYSIFNTSDDYGLYYSISGDVVQLNRRIVAGIPYRIINDLGIDIAPPITRPIVGSTAIFSSPVYSTNPALGPNIRNQLTIVSSRITQIRVVNQGSNVERVNYNIESLSHTIYLEEYDNTTTPPTLITYVPYDTPMNAIDLNTGGIIKDNLNNNFVIRRVSCVITNITVGGGNVTFTADTSITGIIRSSLTGLPVKPSFLISVGPNTQSLSGVAPGNYFIANAVTNVSLAFFTIP
jgi:hypothetical protein